MLTNLHLHLKTDKRPNGTKIAAVEKIEYINREGKYKDLDEKRMREHDIFQYAISSTSPIEKHLLRDQLLYESPFGKIKQTSDGRIMVSKNASIETIAIALAVAEKIYNGNLTISDDVDFCAKVFVAGNEINLPLRFSNEEMDKKYNAIKEAYHNERKQSNSKFGAGRSNNEDSERTNFSVSNAQSNPGGAAAGEQKLHMSVLPKRNMAIHRTTRSALLLHGPQRVLLHDQRAKHNTFMRWNFRGNGKQRNEEPNVRREWPRWNLGAERRERAANTATLILKNLQHQLDRTYAYSHIQYINREAAFQQRGGCIGKGCFLPTWAKNDPKKFFAAADRYERLNGERYKEIEFSLPNELPYEVQKGIVEEFIRQVLKGHYYAYAIHDKIGAMSDGAHNVHVHIMFSTRQNDDYEKTVGRTAEKFFSRANSKSPEKGGCPKSKLWTDKDRNSSLRNKIRPIATKIINEALAKNGFSTQISSESLKHQKDKAEKLGDKISAELLDRDPEEHIDLKICLRHDKPIDELKQRRQVKNLQAKNILAGDIAENSIADSKLRKHLMLTHERLMWLLKKKPDRTAALLPLKQELERKDILWAADSFQIAARKFMTQQEKKLYEQFISVCRDRTQYLKMRETSKTIKNELTKDLTRKIDEDTLKIKKMAPQVTAIFARLESQKVNILQEQRAMLQKNVNAKRAIIKAIHNVNTLWQKEKNKSIQEEQQKQQRIYTITDIHDILWDEYHVLKEAYEKQRQIVENLRKRVISEKRAIAIAKNVYTKGGYKSLREKFRALQKDEVHLAQDKNKIIVRGNDSDRMHLAQREQELIARRKHLMDEQTRLDELCSTPEAKQKIHEIALGIIKKNQPAVKEFEAALQELNSLRKRLYQTKGRLDVSRQRSLYDKNIYKTKIPNVAPSVIAAHNDARLIADALAGQKDSLPKVMVKPSGDNDDTPWSELSDIAKAERLADSRFREDW